MIENERDQDQVKLFVPTMDHGGSPDVFYSPPILRFIYFDIFSQRLVYQATIEVTLKYIEGDTFNIIYKLILFKVITDMKVRKIQRG